MKQWMALSAAMAGMAVARLTQAQEMKPADEPKTKPVREIVVSLEDRKLALLVDGQTKKTYIVAVGKSSTPSPVGEFTIQRRVANPTYSHNGRTVLPGPGNPVGTRWMGLSVHGYGIHGTNEPKSIGKAASHGCIRMGKADLEEFYTLVAVGDTVRIVGQRNEETARLFGPAKTERENPTELAAKPEPAREPAEPVAEPVAARVALAIAWGWL